MPYQSLPAPLTDCKRTRQVTPDLPWSLASSPVNQIHHPSNCIHPLLPSLILSPQQHSLPFHSLRPLISLPRILSLRPRSQTQQPFITLCAPYLHRPSTHTHSHIFSPYTLRNSHLPPLAPSPLSPISSALFHHLHSFTAPAVMPPSLSSQIRTLPVMSRTTTRAPSLTVQHMRRYGAAAGGALKEQETWVLLTGGATKEGIR